MADKLNFTLQAYWEGRWHDAGQVLFRDPDKGLTGNVQFTYDPAYVAGITERHEGFDFNDARAIGMNIPGNLMTFYQSPEVAAVIRDIIPQGAGRRYLLRHWGMNPRQGPSADTLLLKEGCISPIGNLRIKEAAERFQETLDRNEVMGFSRKELGDRNDDMLEYAQSLGLVIGSATGAGGDAPKLLVVEDAHGEFYLEGTLEDHLVKQHWLVKFPRGDMRDDDRDVLRGEATFYKALAQCGVNTLDDPILHEGQVPSLWLPRFDRAVVDQQVERYGVESMYSLHKMIGDGSQMFHTDVLKNLKRTVNTPADFDQVLCDYLVRDVINYAIGNSDNHGRNTALLKTGSNINLAPAYDLAPMVLDREAIARATVWPKDCLLRVGEPDYLKVILVFSGDPERATNLFTHQLERLRDLKSNCEHFGLPDSVFDHARIRLDFPGKLLRSL